MSDPFQNLVRQDVPDQAASKAVQDTPVVTAVPRVTGFQWRCHHDNNWPYGQWCGGLLIRHIDGGYAYCPAGHKFE